MVTLAKGKLSYYVLSCLAERDMYGLELIEQIKLRFNIDIKLPSLYSNLNRMKELKFVSTYLKESNKGPKCSYSSITEKGRNELENLKTQWADEESTTLSTENIEEKEESNPIEDAVEENEIINDEENEIQDEIESQNNVASLEEDYDDYFSIPSEDNSLENNEIEEEIEDDVADETIEEEQIETITDIQEEITESVEIEDSKPENEESPSLHEEFDEEVDEEIELKEESEVSSFVNNADEIKQISEIKEEYFNSTEIEEKKDDYAQFTENKKLFDITQDFSKYKKKKSFTENQMVMNVNTSSPLHDEEKKQSDVSSLKQTIMNSRDGNYEPIDRFAEKEKNEEATPTIAQNLNNEYKKFNEETKDDGLFITERIPQSEIPKAHKIEMSKLSFTIQNNYNKMPAPNRNAALDPSCSDVKARLQKLYEKTTAKKEEEHKTFRDYETFEELKDYYKTQDIDFKIYDKPEGKIRHNTNKLLMFAELILFGLTGIASALFFLIFNAVGGTISETLNLSFLYYLFPILSFVMLVYRFYNYKFGVSRVPKPMLKPVIMWALVILGSIAIFCFAIVCGLNLRLPITYCSCIIYPIIVLGIWVAARHYITIALYKKYWR